MQNVKHHNFGTFHHQPDGRYDVSDAVQTFVHERRAQYHAEKNNLVVRTLLYVQDRNGVHHTTLVK